MAFLIDSGWIQVILAAVALLVSIVLYRKARTKKSLSYEVVSEYPLISVDDEIKGKLQILLNGKPVENVHLLSIRFINDGNVPIIADDYERPLSVTFEGEPNILSTEFVSGSPDKLTITLKVDKNALEIEPVLMNSGDFFSIKILIGQYSGKYDIDYRIVGVKTVRRRRQIPTERPYVSSIALAFTITAAITTITAFYFIFTSYRATHISADELARRLVAIEAEKLNQPPRVVSTIIPPAAVRGGAVPVVKGAGDVQVIRFQLELPGDSYPSYRAELQTVEGKTLVALNDLISNSDTHVVTINIPSRILLAGDYKIELIGKTPDGRTFPVSSYFFRIDS